MFLIQSASWKRHCVTHWREQRGMDSYLPRQISQSDCEISSNCGTKKKKNIFTVMSQCELGRTSERAMLQNLEQEQNLITDKYP